MNAQKAKYLVSPKTFHLEMPLYMTWPIGTEGVPGDIFRIIYTLMSSDKTMDAYCTLCKKDGVFKPTVYYGYSFDSWQAEFGIKVIKYICTRVEGHQYLTYYYKGNNQFQKIGQIPSTADFQIPQVEKYRKVLGEEKYQEFTKGIGLNAHGVGIGAFVYLRRIFENLIEEAHKEAKKTEGFDEAVYMASRMDERIEILKDRLPEFLVEQKTLYSILSKGLHELTEEECLGYFMTVRLGIEQILDEKIIVLERKEKADKARKAIAGFHNDQAAKKAPKK